MIITALHAFPRTAAAELARRVHSQPGPNTVRLRLPDGTMAEVSGTSGLSPDDGAEVSVILGGATVAYDEASVDMAELAQGVTVP